MKTFKASKTVKLNAVFCALLLCGAASAQNINATQNSHAIASHAFQSLAEQGIKVIAVGSLGFQRELGLEAISKATDKDATRKVVVVESGWGNRHELMKLMASGDFVITVGGAAVDPVKSAFGMLHDIKDSGSLQKSAVEYDVDQPRVSAKMPDGTLVYSLVEGYYFSPYESRSFYSTEQDKSMALVDAVQWARDIAMTEGAVPVAKNGTWTASHVRNSNTTCKHTWADTGETVIGKLNIRSSYSKLTENNPDRDVFEVKYTTQMVPGAAIPGSSNWRNRGLSIESDVNAKINAFKLLDYGPTTTSGSSSVSVDLGVNWQSATVGRNWSYSISDISVRDLSRFDQQKVFWDHSIDKKRAVGGNTVKVEPGAIISVGQGRAQVWTHLKERYAATFHNMGDNNIHTVYAADPCEVFFNE